MIILEKWAIILKVGQIKIEIIIYLKFNLFYMNIKLFKILNNLAGKSFLLDTASVVMAEYLSYIFILGLLFLWFKKDKIYKNIILYSIYSVVLGLVLNFLIALVYFHPRPFVLQLGKTLIEHAPDASFPSDHTTFMLSIAFMLLYFKETKYVGAIFVLLGLMGGLARVIAGIHFPADIIGSLFVAIASSFAIFLLKDKLEKFNNLILNLFKKIKQ